MNEGPEWFAPKRYGYGSGLPIAWQGWALLLGYMGVVIGAGSAMERWPLAASGIIVTATALLLIITAKTTRGGWRWRSGQSD